MRSETGQVHGAYGAVLEPVIVRYRGIVKRLYFRGRAAFANPDMQSSLKPRGSATRSGCRQIPSCKLTRAAQCPHCDGPAPDHESALSGTGNLRRRQVAGPVQLHQTGDVPPICPDPPAHLGISDGATTMHSCPSADTALDAITARLRLIAEPWLALLAEFADRIARTPLSAYCETGRPRPQADMRSRHFHLDQIQLGLGGPI
jgi:hypothetical protein